jgi:hypothetical protein
MNTILQKNNGTAAMSINPEGINIRRYLMLAVRLMFTVQLGTLRGRYDEYSSKVFPQ